METTVHLRPFDGFTRLERVRLIEVVEARGWSAFFVHDQQMQQEHAYLYRGRRRRRLQWIVGKSGVEWVAWDTDGEQVAEARDSEALIETLANGRTARRAPAKTTV